MRSPDAAIDELVMTVRMLVSALKRYEPDHPVAAKATRLLADRGLLRGNGLRAKKEYVQLDCESLARSADLVATRLAAADMVRIDSRQDGVTMGRDGQLIGPEGGPLIALDAGPGRGFVGPRWQFDPVLQATLSAITEALGTSAGWALLSFLEAPHGALAGYTPRQAIEQGRFDQVLQLARSDGDGS